MTARFLPTDGHKNYFILFPIESLKSEDTCGSLLAQVTFRSLFHLTESVWVKRVKQFNPPLQGSSGVFCSLFKRSVSVKQNVQHHKIAAHHINNKQ